MVTKVTGGSGALNIKSQRLVISRQITISDGSPLLQPAPSVVRRPGEQQGVMRKSVAHADLPHLQQTVKPKNQASRKFIEPDLV